MLWLHGKFVLNFFLSQFLTHVEGESEFLGCKTVDLYMGKHSIISAKMAPGHLFHCLKINTYWIIDDILDKFPSKASFI